MNKINYKIYLMAMIELLINNNSQTDLGDHILEYQTEFAEIGGGDMTNGDACLAVAVRLRNKANNLVEWGNIYYKRLIPNSDTISVEAREKLKNIVSEISLKSREEKLNFILSPENGLSKKPYAKSSFVDNKLAVFFENLNTSGQDGYPVVSLNGKLEKETLTSIETSFNNIIDKVQNFSGYKRI